MRDLPIALAKSFLNDVEISNYIYIYALTNWPPQKYQSSSAIGYTAYAMSEQNVQESLIAVNIILNVNLVFSQK